MKVHTKCSGHKFNSHYKGIKFYKFLYDDLTHNDFQYKLGVNNDTSPFYPEKNCSRGGLYFCEESNRDLFCRNYGRKKVALIEIPDDVQVYIENDKFKADKIIINEITHFDDVDDEFWISMLRKNGLILQFIKYQTDEMCRIAVKQHSGALQYVKKQTNELCRLAIQKDGDALRFVRKQTQELCDLAVKNDLRGYVVEFVKKPFKTEELCKRAAQNNPYAIKYMDNVPYPLREELYRMAVKQNGFAIQYINQEPSYLSSDIMTRLAYGLPIILSSNSLSSSLSKSLIDELCTLAVKQDPQSIYYVKNQTEELCSLSVKQNGTLLYYVNDQTEDICKLAVQQDGKALRYVKNQTVEICTLALKQNKAAIEYVHEYLKPSLGLTTDLEKNNKE